MRGVSSNTMQPQSGSSGLSANNAAIRGYAARRNLAIFADENCGRGASKEWIQKNYGKVTLAESIKAHLGPTSSHVKGVDFPDRSPKLMQQYLDDTGKGYAANYVASTTGQAFKEGEWSDVIDAFGYAEGYSSRREIPGQPGKFHYVINKGIIFRCAGRDPIDVDPAYRHLKRVTDIPQTTPPEIKKFLGCP